MPYIYNNLEYYDMLNIFYESRGKSTINAFRSYLEKFPERKELSKNTFIQVKFLINLSIDLHI